MKYEILEFKIFSPFQSFRDWSWQVLGLIFILTGLFLNAQFVNFSPPPEVSGTKPKIDYAAIYPIDKTQAIIDLISNDAVLRNAKWGFCLYDPKNKEVIISKDAEDAYLPASTTKLITTETAFALIGEDYKWKTEVLYDGEIDANNTLNGNIYVVSNGDFSLGFATVGALTYNQILAKVGEALKEAGIKKVTGNIITETVVFKGDEKLFPKTKFYVDMGQYYSIKPDTSQVYAEEIRSENTEETDEEKVEIIKDELTEEEVAEDILAILENSKKLIKVNADENLNKGLPTPPNYLANQIRLYLTKYNGPYYGKVITQNYQNLSNKNKKLLVTIDSPPLKDIVYFVNQTSNNHYSHLILNSIGYVIGKQNTQTSSINEVMNHLYQSKFDLRGFKYADGSGLSRSNWVTPLAQVKYLSNTLDKPYFPAFYESLPKAGETGTLKGSFKYSPLIGRLRAKTGTLNAVKCLAGYIDTKSGERLTFSLLINSYSGSVAQVKQKMELLLNTIADY